MYLTRILLSIVFVLFASTALAQGKKAEHAEGVQDLIDATGGKVQISVDSQSGLARFIRLPQTSHSAALEKDNASAVMAPPQQRAMDFLRSHGSAFGVTDANSELTAVGTTRDSMGNQHSVFRQTHHGLPVFGGELRAHFNANGDLFAVNGTFASEPKISTNPSLTPDEAAGRAIRAVTLQQYQSAQAAAKAGDNAISPDKDDLNDHRWNVHSTFHYRERMFVLFRGI